MPIDLDEWQNIEERELKSNAMLLDWMRNDQAYTTTEVQNSSSSSITKIKTFRTIRLC